MMPCTGKCEAMMRVPGGTQPLEPEAGAEMDRQPETLGWATGRGRTHRGIPW